MLFFVLFYPSIQSVQSPIQLSFHLFDLFVCLSIRLFVCLFIRSFFFSFFSFSCSSTFPFFPFFLFLPFLISSPSYILEVLIFSNSRTINPRLNAYRSRRLNALVYPILRNQNRTDHGQTSFSTCGVHPTFKCLIYELKNVRVIISENIPFFPFFCHFSCRSCLSVFSFSLLLFFISSISFAPDLPTLTPIPNLGYVINIPENQLKISEFTNFPLLLLQILTLFIVVYIE